MQNLKVFIICILLFLCYIHTNSQIVCGVYKNTSRLGSMPFTKELHINCDSSVSATYVGDLFNEKLEGNWETINDTLVVRFKPYMVRNLEQKSLFDYGHFDSISFYFIGKKGIVLLNPNYIHKTDAESRKIIEYICKHYKKFGLKRVKKFKCK